MKGLLKLKKFRLGRLHDEVVVDDGCFQTFVIFTHLLFSDFCCIMTYFCCFQTCTLVSFSFMFFKHQVLFHLAKFIHSDRSLTTWFTKRNIQIQILQQVTEEVFQIQILQTMYHYKSFLTEKVIANDGNVKTEHHYILHRL